MKTNKLGCAWREIKIWIGRFFSKNALDNDSSRKVLFRRIGKEFISRESREIVLALPIVGLLVALTFLVLREKAGPLAAGLEWLFKNATDLEGSFYFSAIGLMSYLVGSHKPLKLQGPCRRLLLLPIFRIANDTVAAAFTSFLAVFIWCAVAGPVALNHGNSVTQLTTLNAAGSMAYYGLGYFLFTGARLLIDPPITEELTKPIHKKDPGLTRTLQSMGWGSLVIFTVLWSSAYGLLRIQGLWS